MTAPHRQCRAPRAMPVAACILLAGALVSALAPAQAGPTASPAGTGVDALLDLRYQDATLADLARDAQRRGGIAISVPAALRKDVLRRNARTATWAEGLQELLGGYNYVSIRGPGGAVERIIIQGRQNSGKNARAAVPPPTGAALFEVDSGAASRPLPKALAAFNPRAVTPIKLSVERLAKMKPGEMLSVRLGDHAYQLVHDQAQRHGSGDTSWIATVDQGGAAFRAVLTYRADGAITGQINTPRGLFEFIQFDGTTWVIDLKASGLGAGSLEEDQRTFGGSGKSSAAAVDAPPATARARATVDLMVLYTHPAGPLPVLRVNHLLVVTQQALNDSGAFVNLQLVRAERIDYADNTPNSTALENLTHNRLGPDVSAARKHYGADLVVLLRPFHASAQGSCGVSWVGGSNNQPLTADAGFSVVSDGFDDRYYCHDYTFAHELGHVFGNVHDAELSPPGIFPFSYAWAVPGKFATIMSYLFDVAPLVGKFANPAITCTDKGLPCGRKGIADNARTINLTAPTVADFVPTAAD